MQGEHRSALMIAALGLTQLPPSLSGASTLKTIRSISSDTAANVVTAALAEARKRDVNVCAVVLDEAGRFLAGRCMDGVTTAAFEVATAKAKHSANFRRPTKFQEDLLMTKNALPVLAVPGMLPLEGGLPIQHGGECVGAIGISGAASDVDGAIAAAAVASAAGL